MLQGTLKTKSNLKLNKISNGTFPSLFNRLIQCVHSFLSPLPTPISPTKRALLIDSDRDDDLRDDLEGQHQQHSSSSLSSLTSSQQLRRQDDQLGNNDNGKDIRMETSSRRGLPASGDKPFIMTAKEDDAGKQFSVKLLAI